ncbi:bZIP transcription factor 39-like [Zingiber officinale]|uniref:BZIP domain-containing protein n=1 Tax=Zingiber officinale TaxID=94328 RepID=A0A8J5GQ42_ZINOF|nr:bZIP transcription factor 39-like [Zingiber officinale]KAG6507795.1 hypothetical protein ZIOFF_033147 [Zingiber officinale]
MAESSPLDLSDHPPPVFDLPCDPLAPRPYDDFDLDLVFDWDFSVDDFLQSTDNQPSHAPDDLPDPFSGGGSGNVLSSSSPPPLHHQSFDFPHESNGSHPASPYSGNSSQESGVVDKGVKVEAAKILKRKTDRVEGCFDATFNKLQRSGMTEDEEEDKKKERMMRNRESAQLSRQRKKKYVEELEDKVKSMQSMINQLNAKISYVMAENTTLRQQLGGGGGTGPAVYPPVGAIPPMHLSWLPGYGWRPQGSQVPLVPIPKLKPHQPASAKSKKTRSKTKKVASVSLLGLLLFVVVVCGLVPEIHLWYQGTRNEIDNVERRILNGSIGKVLDVSGRNEVGLSTRSTRLEKDGSRVIQVHNGGPLPSTGSISNAARQNSSDTLPALLYVPRNGKLVKIDGNLIIHSVLAGEKAMAQAKEKCSVKESKGTSLAVAGDTMSALAVPNFEREVDRSLPDKRYGNNFKETSVDGPVSQWFREGMAGPLLNSGLCTEVFQFDISPTSSSGGIIPTTSIVNATSMDNTSENFTSAPGRQTAIKSRRMKYTEPAPLNATVPNDTQQFRKPSEGSNFGGDKPVTSIVVSVLADPKEAGIGDGEGMISPKSISRIFVVVLLDSVKYVTYSCVLPFKTSVPVL